MQLRRRPSPSGILKSTYYLLVPFVLLFLVTLVVPTVHMFIISLTSRTTGSNQSSFQFIKNYVAVFSTRDILRALVTGVLLALCTTTAKSILTITITVLIGAEVAGKKYWHYLLLLPLSAPPSVVGLLWLGIFDDLTGVANALLLESGVIQQPVGWLSHASTGFCAIGSAMVWRGYPLFLVLIFFSLRRFPAQLYEAACLDGASPIMAWRHILLPYLLPAISVAWLLSFLLDLAEFDIIYILGCGGPGGIFMNALMKAYEIGIVSNRMPLALAIGFTVVPFALFVIFMVAGIFSRWSSQWER